MARNTAWISSKRLGGREVIGCGGGGGMPRRARRSLICTCLTGRENQHTALDGDSEEPDHEHTSKTRWVRWGIRCRGRVDCGLETPLDGTLYTGHVRCVVPV